MVDEKRDLGCFCAQVCVCLSRKMLDAGIRLIHVECRFQESQVDDESNGTIHREYLTVCTVLQQFA